MTITAFLLRATALALVEHPLLNASLDADAGEIVVHRRRDIGVAVDTPDGLVLPVVRNADERSLFELAGELARLGEAARARRLTPAELAGGTFTISNHGVFGGWFGTSLVHGSEVGIAGFGPARRRPEFDDHDRVVARRVLVIANLAADHRVVDGRDIISLRPRRAAPPRVTADAAARRRLMVAGEIARPVDVLVIGGGPGGYTAAARAAELGRSSGDRRVRRRSVAPASTSGASPPRR